MALTKDRNLSKENGIMKFLTTFLCLEQAIVDTLHESKQYWNNRIVYIHQSLAFCIEEH